MANGSKVTGGDQVKRNLNRILLDVVPSGIAQGLYLEGNNLMADSKENYVPVDLGVLTNTGYVTLPEKVGSVLVVELGFGGPAEAYALPVHERTELRHEVGEAKYLEKPYDLRRPKIARNVAALARGAIERGVRVTVTQAPGTITDPWRANVSERAAARSIGRALRSLGR